jgi:8-oxo-dGTP pyrophosphatase MutT (NUDIX family)
MKTEISSGGIVVRKIRNAWHVLILRDMSNNWTFPKGMIEEGESKKDAAVREIGEEVGLTKLKYINALSSIEYVYKRGSLIHKTVHYFLLRAVGTEKIVCQTTEGIKEAKWVPFDQAIACIGYEKTNIPLLKKAQKLLQKTEKR